MGKRLDPKKNRFGPYALVEELAVGGMAEVFLANHHALDGVLRKVVVKRMLDQFSDDEEFRSMFLHEARLMAALSHPNIAQIYDVGRDRKGRLYLVMEYIRGATLRELAYRAERSVAGKVPRKFAISVALAIAEGLQYVHTRRDPDGQPLGIVHRDLNPANVMVTHDGAVKLIDFGIAKAASSMVQTATGIVKGTRGYMAPEQITGKRVDHRADVFNLGVILYELLLGRHPFESENRGAQLLKVVEGRWTPPTVYDPNFPPGLGALLEGCLAADREVRPESVAQIIEHLVHHQRQEGLSTSLSELGEMVSLWMPSASPAVHLHRQVDLEAVKAEPPLSQRFETGNIMEETDPTLVQMVVDDRGAISTTEVTRLAETQEAHSTPPMANPRLTTPEDEATRVSTPVSPGDFVPRTAPEDDEHSDPGFEQSSSIIDASGEDHSKPDGSLDPTSPLDSSASGADPALRQTVNQLALPTHSRSHRFGQLLVIVLGLGVVALSAYLAVLLNE